MIRHGAKYMRKYFKILSSTPAEIKSVLKSCQVLSNVYLKVLKYTKVLTFDKYKYTSWNQKVLKYTEVLTFGT